MATVKEFLLYVTANNLYDEDIAVAYKNFVSTLKPQTPVIEDSIEVYVKGGLFDGCKVECTVEDVLRLFSV